MPVLPLPRYPLPGVKLAQLKYVKSTFDPLCMRQITCLTNLLVTLIIQTRKRLFRSSMARKQHRHLVSFRFRSLHQL